MRYQTRSPGENGADARFSQAAGSATPSSRVRPRASTSFSMFVKCDVMVACESSSGWRSSPTRSSSAASAAIAAMGEVVPVIDTRLTRRSPELVLPFAPV